MHVKTFFRFCRGVAFNSEVILTGDENSDIFMWDMARAVDSATPDGDPNLLLHTLTGTGSNFENV